jgi:GNAT superfamily N-acetyltransferase
MNKDITLRPATAADTPAVFRLFYYTVRELAVRQGVRDAIDGGDPNEFATIWEQRRPMYEHLERTAHQFWLAERGDQIVGYARSILRDGALELTEFFVLPDEQSGGVGRELLARTFTAEGTRSRTIIATTDLRAQARYLKTGVYPRFPIYYFNRKPEIVAEDSDLRIETVEDSPRTLEVLGALDAAVLGYRRDVDHQWFLTSRSGFLYHHDDAPVGYGYVSRGSGSGPFALLDAADYPAALAHAESVSARGGHQLFGVQVPMINRAAIDYLLRRGFRIDPFVTLYMSDGGDGSLDRYIVTSPPFFM